MNDMKPTQDDAVSRSSASRTTPGQQGHAGLSTAAAREASELTERLARKVGHHAAVSWVHAGAVLAWCAWHRRIPGVEPVDLAAELRATLVLLAAQHPALEGFTDPAVMPLWDKPIEDTAVAEIRALWGRHPLDDPPHRPHGYLLGNAYQAIGEEARKHRALAQTPRYVTQLLLQLAMDPAKEQHPLPELRFMDPSCGTGHILVEAMVSAAVGPRPTRAGGPPAWNRGRVEQAMDAVRGVDLDPYAALLARLRLLVLGTACMRLDRVPAGLPVHVAATDALLDRDEPLLQRGQYHVIVGNPPYVTPKTAKARDAIRAAYPDVCHKKYALSLPFFQLMTELLVPGGWCSQLTANSFMKREFGKPFIEKYLPRFDLQWVIDTSGAYIPGHGTPTVILAHRNQAPQGDTVAAVLGKQGEPRAPEDPSRGLVWRAIEDAVDMKLAYRRLAAAMPAPTPQPVEVPAPPAEPNPAVAEQLSLFAAELQTKEPAA